MTWQRTNDLAKGLWDKEVKSVIAEDLRDEWYLYSIAHLVGSPGDILPNLERYYSRGILRRMMLF